MNSEPVNLHGEKLEGEAGNEKAASKAPRLTNCSYGVDGLSSFGMVFLDKDHSISLLVDDAISEAETSICCRQGLWLLY